jgi:hypothetical protein
MLHYAHPYTLPPQSRRQHRVTRSGAVLALAAGYVPVRRWFSRWGTTPEELARAMPGDHLIANAVPTGMQIVTVNAPPEAIWPWLVQMGSTRGGWYSYDWLDRLFGFLDRPSATRILPEFQDLAEGDKIALGRQEVTAAVLDPPHVLAWSYHAYGIDDVWQLALYPIDEHRTRLVSRVWPSVPSLLQWLPMHVMEPAGFVMTRPMLLNVKQRAEATQ